MGSAIHHAIAENYQRLSYKFSPSDNGGILNYAFKPIQDQFTQKTLLDTDSFSANSMLNAAQQLILKSNHSVRVLEVLPQEVQPDNVAPPNYFATVIAGGIAIVLAILMSLAILILPCYLKKWAKKSVSKYASISYFITQLLTVLLVVVLILCVPIAFSALSYFLSAVDPKQPGSGKPEITQNLDVIFNETKLFLQELVSNGNNLTKGILDDVQSEVKTEVTSLVDTILNQLLAAYGATKLINETKELKASVEPLGQTTGYIAVNVENVVNKIENFTKEMENNTNSLSNSFDSLCKKPKPPLTNQCNESKNSLNSLKVNFNASEIPTQTVKSLSGQVNESLKNAQKILDEFDKLQITIDNKTKDITDEINSKINLTNQFSSISEIWASLNKDVAIPVTQQMDTIRPQIDRTLELAGKIGSIAGYVLLATYLLILAIVIIYVVLCTIEGFKNGFMPFCQNTGELDGSGESSKNKVAFGFALPAVLAVTIPIVVIIGVAIVLVTGVVNNEACRYVDTTSGIKISDAALNLYLEYKWPSLISEGKLDPTTSSMLRLTAPQNPLNALLVTCKASMDNQLRPGLVPALGIENLINVTAVINRPEIQNTIKDGENTLVNEIVKLKLDEFLPKDLDETLGRIKNVTHQLNDTNFEEPIEQLTKFIPDRQALESNLSKISDFVRPLANNDTDAKSILDTVEKIKVDLTSLDSIKADIAQLGASFHDLTTKKDPIVTNVDNFLTHLNETAQILKDKDQIKKPIHDIYQRGVDAMFNNLSREMEQQTAKFTKEVVSCDRINLVVSTTVGMSCGTYGLVNRLGGLMFLFLVLGWALLVMILVFQLYLGYHERHCLHA